MIIDFHVHAFPDRLAERAIKQLTSESNFPAYTNGKLSDIIRSMNEGGVDKSVIANIATNPGQMQNVNNFAIESNSDRIIAFGSVHPDSPDWEDELIRIKEAGLKGIKLHPDYQEFYVDDPRIFPIYRKTAELKIPVLFHCGYDDAGHEPVRCTPERFARVIDAVDTNMFVMAHMGGYKFCDDTIKYIAGKSVYLDTSYSLNNKMPEDKFMEIVSKHGVDRILFATDSPWEIPAVYVGELNRLIADEETRNKIFYKNAERLLNL